MMFSRKEMIVLLSALIALIIFVMFYTPKPTYIDQSTVAPSLSLPHPPRHIKTYIIGSPIDLERIPAVNVKDLYFGERNGRTVTYLPEDEQRNVTYKGNEIRFPSFYPDRSELGFYYISTTTPEIIQLIILDTQSGKFKEIYKDDYHFSSWMWNEFDTVTVRRDCGTQCIRAKMFNFKTGKTIAEYFEF